MKSYLKFYSNCKILNDIEKSCSPAHVMFVILSQEQDNVNCEDILKLCSVYSYK